VATLGRQMTVVALPYQVWVTTRSPLAVGLVGVVQAAAIIIAGAYGGPLADRFDRRRVLLASRAVLGVTALSLALGAATHRLPLWVVYAIAAVASASYTVEHAARSATVPRLVPPHRLAAAMSLVQVLFQTAQVLGPALAGVVIAQVGVTWAYAIDAACVPVALGLIWTMKAQPPAPDAERLSIGAPLEVLRLVGRSEVLLGIFSADLVAMLFAAPRALYPVLASEVFHVGPSGLGLLYAAPGAGALAASVLSGWVSRIRRQGVAVLWAVVAWGGAITAFGLSGRLFPLALVMLALAGASDMISAVFRHTILQLNVADSVRGRMSAFNTVVVSAGPGLGDLRAGAVASLVSPVFSVVSGGLACLAAVVVLAVLTPGLRRQMAPVEKVPTVDPIAVQ
jgi:MFS family permease